MLARGRPAPPALAPPSLPGVVLLYAQVLCRPRRELLRGSRRRAPRGGRAGRTGGPGGGLAAIGPAAGPGGRSRPGDPVRQPDLAPEEPAAGGVGAGGLHALPLLRQAGRHLRHRTSDLPVLRPAPAEPPERERVGS